MNIRDNFNFDRLALLMLMLIVVVGLSVAIFAYRYLQGDCKRPVFYRHLTVMLVALALMVCSDHVLLFYLSWGLANFCLTRLMVHKSHWQAARESAKLTWRYLAIALIPLGLAFGVMYGLTGQTSISSLGVSLSHGSWGMFAACLILLCAMVQSGLWPFHKWLISSLNAPTPVSAIMHAGLVNGGGFLLVRFSPLYLNHPTLFEVIFLVGALSAILGSVWKLMQNDVKRMLACSTVGQMGFMMVQFGLGLLPAALAHLLCHGLFKAYWFLGSGSALEDRSSASMRSPRCIDFVMAVFCGALGAWSFSNFGSSNITFSNTSSFLLAFVLVAGTQLALPVVSHVRLSKLFTAAILTALAGWLYGFAIRSVSLFFRPHLISHPMPLTSMHLIVLSLFIVVWLMFVFWHRWFHGSHVSTAMLSIYVRMLNGSQPHPKTVTAHRNQYQY